MSNSTNLNFYLRTSDWLVYPHELKLELSNEEIAE